MRLASISFVLLLVPSIGLAQSSGREFSAHRLPSLMDMRLPELVDGCPVGLRVQRQGSTNLVVVDGKQQRQISPTVRLTMNNLQGRNIVGATVRVRGYGTQPQLFPIQRGSSPGVITKTVSVKLDIAQGKSGQTDVTAEKFGSVSRIYLEMVEYADGTVWRANQDQPCSVEPDLVMLVAGK